MVADEFVFMISPDGWDIVGTKVAKKLYTLWPFVKDIPYADLSIFLFDSDLGAKGQKLVETTVDIAVNDQPYSLVLT